MKRPGKKVATDRSFVVALSRGLDVLRAFRPNDGLLGNQEIAARTNLPKPTVSRLTYTLTKLGYLTPVPRFEKYQLAPSAMALGYAALANLGVRHLSEPFREEVMRETGGAVAVGGRDRLSMIYFGQSRGMTLGRSTGRRFANSDCNHRDGPGLYLGAAGTKSVPPYCANCASITAAAGRGCATASNAPARPWPNTASRSRPASGTTTSQRSA